MLPNETCEWFLVAVIKRPARGKFLSTAENLRGILPAIRPSSGAMR
jgi:hypothetical protein